MWPTDEEIFGINSDGRAQTDTNGINTSVIWQMTSVLIHFFLRNVCCLFALQCSRITVWISMEQHLSLDDFFCLFAHSVKPAERKGEKRAAILDNGVADVKKVQAELERSSVYLDSLWCIYTKNSVDGKVGSHEISFSLEWPQIWVKKWRTYDVGDLVFRL